jgi:hypothetical protein
VVAATAAVVAAAAASAAGDPERGRGLAARPRAHCRLIPTTLAA